MVPCGCKSYLNTLNSYPPHTRTSKGKERYTRGVRHDKHNVGGGRAYTNKQSYTVRHATKPREFWLGSTDGWGFEKVCAKILERCGFEVENVGGVKDGGRDIIIWSGGKKIIVECKHQQKTAGRPVVQKLHSAVKIENAAGGIVISTGGFSTEAEEYPVSIVCMDNSLDCIRRIRHEKVVLIDMDNLFSLAKAANVTLHTGSEPAAADANIDSIKKVFASVKGSPKDASELAQYKVMGLHVDTYWYARVRVKQDFRNSAGKKIHKMNKKKDWIFGPEGNMCRGSLAKLVRKGGDIKPRKTSDAAVQQKVVEYARVKFTKKVKYEGQNGVTYTIECKPSSNLITSVIRPVGIRRREVQIKILRVLYEWDLPDWNKKKIECKMCGETTGLLKPLLLCNECGRIVHKRSCGDRCNRCKKTVCDICAQVQHNILKTKRFCSNCAYSQS